MSKSAITRAGALAKGALAVYLHPKLAQDASVDLDPIVGGVTRKTFRSQLPVMVLAVKGAVHGKLAKDADIEDVAEVVEALADILPEEVQEVAKELDDDGKLEGADDPDAAKDDDNDVVAFLTGKLSEEDLAKVKAMLADSPVPAAAMDAAVKAAVTKATKGLITKPAMDAAIAEASRAAAEAATTTQREIREAEKAVRPWVGELALAHDSAEGVYRTALTTLGVKVAGIHASAFPALLEAQPKPGDRPRTASRLAQDADDAKSFNDRFPNASRLKA